MNKELGWRNILGWKISHYIVCKDLIGSNTACGRSFVGDGEEPLPDQLRCKTCIKWINNRDNCSKQLEINLWASIMKEPL